MATQGLSAPRCVREKNRGLARRGKEVAALSEFQFVAFRAVDRPLTARELAYARNESSRAEITRWSFENEYHFGDFRGDADGLLRHGYDAHLHYANFGVRKIALRLPVGCRSQNRFGQTTSA